MIPVDPHFKKFHSTFPQKTKAAERATELFFRQIERLVEAARDARGEDAAHQLRAALPEDARQVDFLLGHSGTPAIINFTEGLAKIGASRLQELAGELLDSPSPLHRLTAGLNLLGMTFYQEVSYGAPDPPQWQRAQAYWDEFPRVATASIDFEQLYPESRDGYVEVRGLINKAIKSGRAYGQMVGEEKPGRPAVQIKCASEEIACGLVERIRAAIPALKVGARESGSLNAWIVQMDANQLEEGGLVHAGTGLNIMGGKRMLDNPFELAQDRGASR